MSFLLMHCTLAIDADRKQCSTTADCQARGGAFFGGVCQDSVCVLNPAWSCISQPAVPSETKDSFTVRLPLVDVVKLQPMPGVTARLYEKIDVEAATPISEPVTSDADGIIAFNFTAEFDGFAILSNDTILPSMYFFNPAVSNDQTLPPVRLATPAMAAALIQNVGSTFDPARGIVILTAEDCIGQPAQGVSYSTASADSQTLAFYSVDGLPTTLTAATDPSGYGGLIGVVPGTTAITAFQESQGKIGGISLFVKASTISYSRMAPSAK